MRQKLFLPAEQIELTPRIRRKRACWQHLLNAMQAGGITIPLAPVTRTIRKEDTHDQVHTILYLDNGRRMSRTTWVPKR